jgi:hypothetical protein
MMTSKQSELKDSHTEDSRSVVHFQTESSYKNSAQKKSGRYPKPPLQNDDISYDTYDSNTYANFDSRKNSINRHHMKSVDSIDIKSDIGGGKQRTNNSNRKQLAQENINKDSQSCRYSRRGQKQPRKKATEGRVQHNPRVKENAMIEKKNSKLRKLIKLKNCLIETMMDITEREANGDSDDEDVVN